MAGEPQPAGLRFDRNELSGAFGDMGTDLPLLIGMLVASGLDAASVLIVFGGLQIATGIVYRMPMPVQPLKAVAAIVITQRIAPPVLFGGGLAIGVLMLLLTATGLLSWIGRAVPRPVVRGLQLGLGLQLSLLALRDYIPSLGAAGYALAVVSGGIILALFGNRKWPAAPFVIALGVIFAVTTSAAPLELAGPALALPQPRVPQWTDIMAGLWVLALPQLPLSIGNSVLATQQLARDLFPDRPALSLRRIGMTYGIMNVVAPFFGGVPACHGSGGMAGHYAHGGRTGGSVVIYGTLFVLTGLLYSGGFHAIVQAFPLPTLGVLLLVEAMVLIALLRDLPPRVPTGLPLAGMVGLIAAFTPYGYLTGMVAGSLVAAAVAARERAAAR